MKIHFTKMSGAGNDFIVVDNRENIITNPSAFALKVCERRYGIGADGLLLVEKSNLADFQMKYFNADGSNAGMCGNGGRCISKFAFDNNIVSTTSFNFEAFGYIYNATQYAPELYELQMKNPFDIILNQSIKLNNGLIIVANYINTGTDHCVIYLSENSMLGNLQSCDIYKIGREIRYHDLYKPKGTNVNFIELNNHNLIELRTYERGVEDETLACGTGSVASAILSSIKHEFASPVKVKVKSGEILEVGFEKESENSFKNVRLKGSAMNTFFGYIEI